MNVSGVRIESVHQPTQGSVVDRNHEQEEPVWRENTVNVLVHPFQLGNMFQHVESHDHVKRPLKRNLSTACNKQGCLGEGRTGALDGVLAEVNSESRPTRPELLEKLRKSASQVENTWLRSIWGTFCDQASIEFHLARRGLRFVMTVYAFEIVAFERSWSCHF